MRAGWFCLPRLRALLFSPAHFRGTGSRYADRYSVWAGAFHTALNCVVQAKEKALALPDSPLSNSIYSNLLKHQILTTYHP